MFQSLPGLFFQLRPLTTEEIAASLEVHPPNLIPYARVRVAEDSLLLKLGAVLAPLTGDAVPIAMATLHLLHFPRGRVGLGVVVHELTHVAQYEKVGAIYMAEAFYAQRFGGGYNYGDLSQARRQGKHFSDFNREQQAQICEDFYCARHGSPTGYGASLNELEPFIEEMRKGEF
jgi:hypothetical protein